MKYTNCARRGNRSGLRPERAGTGGNGRERALADLSFLSIFFDVDFEASMIDFWRSKFLLFKLKLIFDRFFGPLQNQEGALWGPFCRFREVKIEHPYHTLGVFSILGRFQETSKFH